MSRFREPSLEDTFNDLQKNWQIVLKGVIDSAGEQALRNAQRMIVGKAQGERRMAIIRFCQTMVQTVPERMRSISRVRNFLDKARSLERQLEGSEVQRSKPQRHVEARGRLLQGEVDDDVAVEVAMMASIMEERKSTPPPRKVQGGRDEEEAVDAAILASVLDESKSTPSRKQAPFQREMEDLGRSLQGGVNEDDAFKVAVRNSLDGPKTTKKPPQRQGVAGDYVARLAQVIKQEREGQRKAVPVKPRAGGGGRGAPTSDTDDRLLQQALMESERTHELEQMMRATMRSFKSDIERRSRGGEKKELEEILETRKHLVKGPSRPHVTSRIIPLFETLGLTRGTHYECVHAIGDGKCFFHAICMSLNLDFMDFMRLLKASLLENMPSVYQTETYQDVANGMEYLQLFEHIYDEGRRDGDGDALGLTPERFFDQKWLPDADFMASMTTIEHAAFILLIRFRVGLIIVDNDEGTLHDRFRYLFPMAVERFIYHPVMRFWFGQSLVLPDMNVTVPQIAHIMIINKSHGHYDATRFKCPGTGTGWTYLLCWNGLYKKRHGIVPEGWHPWNNLKVQIDQQVAGYGNMFPYWKHPRECNPDNFCGRWPRGEGTAGYSEQHASYSTWTCGSEATRRSG